tara:strand:- start:49 stop:507 length:459 start_codon:yes stop_codon:yes gene_type:complete
MVQTKEERAAKQKVYNERKKEERRAYYIVYGQENKAHIRAITKEYKEKNKAIIAKRNKLYNDKPENKKRNRLSQWKRLGVLGDLTRFYDIRYLPAVKCEVCKNKFKPTRDKHMDHDHITGEIRFVLCHSCNMRDMWKKHIAANRIIKLFKIL